jgi:hypothetical protein
MMSLHPGAEAIISWEPDDSPQVMTVMTSLEPLDWDNGQPDHTCDWDCLTMHAFCPLSPVLCLLKPVAYVCTLKMAEDGWVFILPLPWHALSHAINLLSLPSPWLFIWHLGAGGQACHVESQDSGPLVSAWLWWQVLKALPYIILE